MKITAASIVLLSTLAGCSLLVSQESNQDVYVIPEPDSGSGALPARTQQRKLSFESQARKSTAAGNFTEAVTGGVIQKFTTQAGLLADLDTQEIAGTLIGTGEEDARYECTYQGSAGNGTDFQAVHFAVTYSAEVTGSFDPYDGTFNVNITPTVTTDASVVSPFTNEQCTALNAEPIPNIGKADGSGTLAGTITSDGSIALETEWRYGNATISGSGEAAAITDSPPAPEQKETETPESDGTHATRNE